MNRIVVCYWRCRCSRSSPFHFSLFSLSLEWKGKEQQSLERNLYQIAFLASCNTNKLACFGNQQLLITTISIPPIYPTKAKQSRAYLCQPGSPHGNLRIILPACLLMSYKSGARTKRNEKKRKRDRGEEIIKWGPGKMKWYLQQGSAELRLHVWYSSSSSSSWIHSVSFQVAFLRVNSIWGVQKWLAIDDLFGAFELVGW